jgi:hypothetical protein
VAVHAHGFDEDVKRNVVFRDASGRKEKSIRGKTTSDIRKLVMITTTSGRIAMAKDGSSAVRLPCGNSAGSNSPAGAA